MDDAQELLQEYLDRSILAEAIEIVKQGIPLDSEMREQLISIAIDPDLLEEEFCNG